MVLTVSLYVGTGLIMFFVGWYVRKRIEKRKSDSAERLAESILAEAEKEAETIKNTAKIETAEDSYQAKVNFERETAKVQQEYQQTEKKLAVREQELERKTDYVMKRESTVEEKLQTLREKDEENVVKEKQLENLIQKQTEQLELSAQMTVEQAKESLLRDIEGKIRTEATLQARSILEEARNKAENEAREIVTRAMQKLSLIHI